MEAIYYAKANGLPLYAAEEEIMGFSHPLVGGLLLRAWKFPDALASCVACHHKPASCAGNVEPAILHVADFMAVGMGILRRRPSLSRPSSTPRPERIGVAPERLGELAEAGLSQVEEIVSAFFPVRKH